MKTFDIGEFYCGPGGLGLAAKLAKITTKNGKTYSFDHSFATDYDEDSCETYRRNIAGNKEVICSDIKNLNIKKLPAVDGFLYGFPCNDFSMVGESKGLDGKFGPLYSYGVTYINYHNPKFFWQKMCQAYLVLTQGMHLKKFLLNYKMLEKVMNLQCINIDLKIMAYRKQDTDL